jgi:penicillin G amidase
VPGWTGEYEWQGFIPFEDLPTVFNPPQGFIATANNKETSLGARYPVTNDWVVPSYRAKRITDLLKANDKVTIDDIRAMQADTYALVAEIMKPYLANTKTENALQASALEQIKAWNLHFAVDSPGALIFANWYRFIIQDSLKVELGDLLNDPNWGHKLVPVIARLTGDADASWFDDVTTPRHETRDDILTRSLAHTVDQLSQQYGSDPARWTLGQMHTISFIHLPLGQSGIAPLEYLFNSQKIPAAGDSDTIDSMVIGQPVNFGSSQRLLIDFHDLENSLSVNSTGQSGQLFHPHREDQIQMWEQVDYHPMLFTQEAVRANAESVLTLTP